MIEGGAAVDCCCVSRVRINVHLEISDKSSSFHMGYEAERIVVEFCE